MVFERAGNGGRLLDPAFLGAGQADFEQAGSAARQTGSG